MILVRKGAARDRGGLELDRWRKGGGEHDERSAA